MKTCRLLFFASALALLTAAGWCGSDEPAEDIFQQALYFERGASDPAAALALYEQVLADSSANAELAAQARWRSGLCLERVGRLADSAARHLDLLNIGDAAPELREAAARTLLRLAEETGSDESASAAWLDVVQDHFPDLAARLAAERAALRRVLRGTVALWDGHQPVQASVRIRARTPAPGAVEGRSIWRTQTDEAGQFAIELPVGAYEIRVGAPAYQRVYLSAALIPEEETSPEIQCVLPRIPLPARIERVEVVGSFLNDWEGGLPLNPVGPGRWEIRQRLGPGSHDYKFRINGEAHLIPDVTAAAFVPDAHEGFNARLVLDREQEVCFRFDENDPHFRRAGNGHMDDD
jgi:hypothetical protein